MATGKSAFGTLLKRETTPSSGTYTTVGGITDLTPPSVEREFEETTDHEAAGGFKTHTPTLGMLGDCSFVLNWDSSDATQEQMMADLIAGTIRNYQIVYTDTGTEEEVFAAYVKSFARQAPVGGIHRANVTLQPTGQVTRSS